MKKIKVMSVFGTRPEAIKMAPLVQTLAQRPEFESICCLTGQHREMLDSVMQIFRLTAQYDLNIMQKQQTLSSITTRALLGMEQALQEAQPDLVLVHGDTSTTFAGALAAFYQKVPVGHVEAGLRTYDRYSPFPEEMNRTLVSDIAALHFAPTSANVENLHRESVQGEIFRTGNTVIDAMRTTVRPDYRFATAELNELDFKSRRVIVLTCHRRENYGQPMHDILRAVRDVAERYEDVEIVYPVHLSPAVRACGDLALCADVPEVHLEARGDGQRAAEQGNGDLDGLADERLRPERAVDDRAIGLQRGIAEGEQQQAADDQGEHDGRDADGPRRSGMYPVDPAGELELACGFLVHVDSLPSDLGHKKTDLFLRCGAGVHDAADLTAAQDQNAVAQLQQHVEVLADEHDG